MSTLNEEYLSILTAAKSGLSPRPNDKNILVIEDNDDVRQILRVVLSYEGYCVRTAIDREEAMAYLHRALFQVILLDYCMPGLSAEKFIDAARKIRPATQIILMTAADLVCERAESLNLPFYLGKPFTTEELLAVMKKTL